MKNKIHQQNEYENGMSLYTKRCAKQKTCVWQVNCDKWAKASQNQQNDLCVQRDSDQPGHLPSLISLRCPPEAGLGNLVDSFLTEAMNTNHTWEQRTV